MLYLRPAGRYLFSPRSLDEFGIFGTRRSLVRRARTPMIVSPDG